MPSSTRKYQHEFDVDFNYSLDVLRKDLEDATTAEHSDLWLQPRGPGGGNTYVKVFTNSETELAAVKRLEKEQRMALEAKLFDSVELRQAVKTRLVGDIVCHSFGDGQDEEMVLNGGGFVGLNNMSDEDLAQEMGRTVDEINAHWTAHGDVDIEES